MGCGMFIFSLIMLFVFPPLGIVLFIVAGLNNLGNKIDNNKK